MIVRGFFFLRGALLFSHGDGEGGITKGLVSGKGECTAWNLSSCLSVGLVRREEGRRGIDPPTPGDDGYLSFFLSFLPGR